MARFPTSALCLFVFVLSCVASTLAVVVPGGALRLRSSELSARNETEYDSKLAKRFGNARFTWFEPGLGACGVVSQPSDFIVALNGAQYDGGAHCFATISISANGKSTEAQIVDLCPGCPFGGLDLSPGLFSFFADLSVGVLTGEWDFL